jgi:hypothetical protein
MQVEAGAGCRLGNTFALNVPMPANCAPWPMLVGNTPGEPVGEKIPLSTVAIAEFAACAFESSFVHMSAMPVVQVCVT